MHSIDKAGRRWHTKEFKQAAVAACRAPGVSLASVALEKRINANLLRRWVKSAEAKLGEMKQATAVRWKEFEAGVSAATARLRKSIESATG